MRTTLRRTALIVAAAPTAGVAASATATAGDDLATGPGQPQDRVRRSRHEVTGPPGPVSRPSCYRDPVAGRGLGASAGSAPGPVVTPLDPGTDHRGRAQCADTPSDQEGPGVGRGCTRR